MYIKLNECNNNKGLKVVLISFSKKTKNIII